MNYPGVLAELIDSGGASLAEWLAEPVAGEQAQQLLADVRQRLGGGCRDDSQRFGLALAEIICRYWSGGDIEAAYGNLCALLSDRRQLALLEFTFGQLLMARRCRRAWRHLDRGFQLAAHLLEPEDYFRVLRRHALLRHLPLSTQPVEPAPLETLLAEARVIARLTGARGQAQVPGVDGSHRDTVG